jgi:hypothetical protein
LPPQNGGPSSVLLLSVWQGGQYPVCGGQQVRFFYHQLVKKDNPSNLLNRFMGINLNDKNFCKEAINFVKSELLKHNKE